MAPAAQAGQNADQPNGAAPGPQAQNPGPQDQSDAQAPAVQRTAPESAPGGQPAPQAH
jgi:hypothetical protein